MTQNVQNNIIIEFKVPKSVELEVSITLAYTLNENVNKVFIMDGGGHI